jgi:hypothetical protein
LDDASAPSATDGCADAFKHVTNASISRALQARRYGQGASYKFYFNLAFLVCAVVMK